MKKPKNGVIKIEGCKAGFNARWADDINGDDFSFLAESFLTPKMLDELEIRGYDLNTLKFEIKKKDRNDEQ